VFDEASETSNLILEDLSRRYETPAWPLPPQYSQCEAAVRLLARVHAATWGVDRQLQESSPVVPTNNWWKDRVTLATTSLRPFLEFLGDRITASRKALLLKIAQSGQALWPFMNGAKTILHGEAHFWNFLYSDHDDDAPVKLVDWNLWDVGSPAFDLAYMMGIHWSPARRGRLEERLLHSYHEMLVDRGVVYYE
jgi:aminoglycoside phosphotransferase (APT) family kinase protein